MAVDVSSLFSFSSSSSILLKDFEDEDENENKEGGYYSAKVAQNK